MPGYPLTSAATLTCGHGGQVAPTPAPAQARVKIQEQPFRLLVILLENAGQVVSREDIQARIWQGNTFVDFDSSLRVALAVYVSGMAIVAVYLTRIYRVWRGPATSYAGHKAPAQPEK